MNQNLAARMNQHVSGGGQTTSIVPGNGYERLSGKTCCTYLHDRAGVITVALLETHPDDDVREATEFLCQQVAFAYSPSPRMQEMGLTGPKNKQITVITYFDGLSPANKDHIWNSILSLSRRAFDMGHLSEWSDAAVEAMTK